MITEEAVKLKMLALELDRKGGKFEFARGMSYGEYPTNMYEAKCASTYTPITIGDPIVFNLDKCYCADSAVFKIYIQAWLKEIIASNPDWVARDNNSFEKYAKALQEGKA